MDDLLIHQVSYHFGGRHAHQFVISLECPLELNEDTLHQDFYDSRELSVNHCYQGSIDMSKVGRCHLRFHDGSSQQALASQ